MAIIRTLQLILVCLCVAHGIEVSCPQGWRTWRDSCYILLTGYFNWFDASLACARPKSSVAVPNSLEENNFIYEIQRENCTKACGMWLGCRREGVVLRCLDEQEVQPFSNFITGPGAHIDGCVMMSASNSGQWQDSQFCTLGKRVICEMPRNQVHVYSLMMASDGRVQPQCLHGHTIKTVAAQRVIECGAACWAEPRCRSFNLRQDGPTKICQLNDITILESDKRDVIDDDKCSHFELEQ